MLFAAITTADYHELTLASVCVEVVSQRALRCNSHFSARRAGHADNGISPVHFIGAVIRGDGDAYRYTRNKFRCRRNASVCRTDERLGRLTDGHLAVLADAVQWLPLAESSAK